MSNSVNYTDQQKNVINEKTRNLMVSASAGSGKTTVMIERVVSLIEQGKTTLDRILILTFTNNSANDMKQKLYSKLNEKNNPFCKKALLSVASADISNIHQFCKKLIQKYFYVCDVDPAFCVMAENEAQALKDVAFKKVVEEAFYQKNEELDLLLQNNFERRNFDKIKETLLNIYQYLCVLDNPKKWLEENSTYSYDDDLEKNEAVCLLVSNIKEQLSAYLSEFEEFEQYVKTSFNAKDFEDITETITKLKWLISCETNSKLIDLLQGITIKKVDYRKHNEIGEFRKQELNPVYNLLIADLKNYEKMFGGSLAKDVSAFLKSSKASVDFLVYLANQFVNEYQKLKEEKFLLDFNDLEKKANVLLLNDGVKAEIEKQFDFCFVDEYQDINNLQEAILSAVSNKSKYFGVGDAKQAIYGFRLCSPEIFLNKFSDYEKQPQTNLATSLNKNFRSQASILNFVNKIFNVIMTEKTASINYEKTSQFETDEKNLEPNVNVLLALEKKEKKESNLPKVYSVENHIFEETQEQCSAKLQATLVANQIASLVKQGCNYGDISILSRNVRGKFIGDFFDYLKDFNIPVKVNFEINLLDFGEVSAIHNLLCLVNNFKDDITLAKVLTSPFFNFSFEKLLEVKNNSTKKFFYDCFLDSQSKDSQVDAFILEMKNLNTLSQNMSVEDFVKYIIEKFDYLNNYKLTEENSIENINKYINFVSSFGFSSLGNYCKITEDGEINVKSDDLNGGDNAVSLNTIHSSKGLEYKFVFLVGIEKKFRFRTQTNTADAVVSKKFGIGLKSCFEDDDEKTCNVVYNAIELSKKKEMMAEEIRLLYVALTRAKEKLFITGYISQKELSDLKTYKNEKEILDSKCFLDLILKSFSKPEISALQGNYETEVSLKGGVVADCKIFEEVALEESLKIDKQKENYYKAKQEKIDQIKKAMQNYEKTVSVLNTDLKNNVSAVVKSSEEISYSSQMFSESENGVSASLGTAYHELFSTLNFNESDKKLKAVAPVEQKFLDLFLESNLYNSLIGKKVLKEVPFLLFDKLPEFVGGNEEKVLLQGILDLLVVDKDGFWVVDYKTTHASDEKIKQRYSNQLKLYAYAGTKILKKPCKKMLIYKIYDGKTLEI